jgi:hypothetical protein
MTMQRVKNRCYGAPPEDPRAHHITPAQEPVFAAARAPDKEAFTRLAALPAPDPCPDPSIVHLDLSF